VADEPADAGAATGDEGGAASDTLNSGGAAETAEPLTPARQTELVTALVDCLTQEGVPVEVHHDAELGWDDYTFTDGDLILHAQPPDGPGFSFRALDQAGLDGIDERLAAIADEYYLSIDDVDYSAAWRQCHLATDYSPPPTVMADPSKELREKQEVAEATNNWIACARANGWPNLPDVTAVADGYATFVVVKLPASITATQLRDLLKACPRFDPELASAANEANQNGGDWDYAAPSIGIDEPEGVWGENGDADTPETRHLAELYDILKEAEKAWLLDLYGPKVDSR
jgi:hypothetical protein